MLYDHSETLKTVASEDVAHVEKMLAKLDTYAQSDGRASLGPFLTALVIGDLIEAVTQADYTNVKYLREYVKYVYNCLPGTHVMLADRLLKVVKRVMRKRERAINEPLTRDEVESAAESLYGLLRR